MSALINSARYEWFFEFQLGLILIGQWETDRHCSISVAQLDMNDCLASCLKLILQNRVFRSANLVHRSASRTLRKFDVDFGLEYQKQSLSAPFKVLKSTDRDTLDQKLKKVHSIVGIWAKLSKGSSRLPRNVEVYLALECNANLARLTRRVS